MPDVLRGGERIEVSGATPSGLLSFELPSFRLSVDYLIGARSEKKDAFLDTVLIQADDAQVILIWRAVLQSDKETLHVSEVRASLRKAA